MEGKKTTLYVFVCVLDRCNNIVAIQTFIQPSKLQGTCTYLTKYFKRNSFPRQGIKPFNRT